METQSTQTSDTAAAADGRPLYLTNRDPDDETDAGEVEDGPEQLAA
jgi:hypothetical protein